MEPKLHTEASDLILVKINGDERYHLRVTTKSRANSIQLNLRNKILRSMSRKSIIISRVYNNILKLHLIHFSGAAAFTVMVKDITSTIAMDNVRKT